MMMWRLRVRDEQFENERVYEGAPVESLTSFDVDGAGSCLTGALSALPSGWDVRARDIVILEWRESSGDAWSALWRGYVTSAPTPRSVRVEPYSLVGMSQRLYERRVTRDQIDAGDVAALARQSIPVGGAPVYGVTAEPTTVRMPDTGFEAGERWPAFEAMGTALDALAALAPSFIVPTGDTYEYDNREWTEGETVPAVRWGVDASGALTFRRPEPVTVTVDEDDASVSVEWLPTVAEDYVNLVRLMFVQGVDSDLLRRGLRVFNSAFGREEVSARSISPLTYVFPEPNADPMAPPDPPILQRAEKLVELENPLDLMTLSTVAVHDSSGWLDTANALDGDPLTYASVDAAAVPGTPRGFGSLIDLAGGTDITLRVTAPTVGASSVRTEYGVWRVTYSTDEPAAAIVALSDASEVAALGEISTEWLFELPSANTSEAVNRSTVFLVSRPAPRVLENTVPGGRVQDLTIVAAAGTRLYQVEHYHIDREAAARVAAAHLRPLRVDSCVVERDGLHEWVNGITVNPSGGGDPVTLDVDRTEWSITREGGAVTRYHAGVDFEPDAVQERVVLERFVERLRAREPRAAEGPS